MIINPLRDAQAEPHAAVCSRCGGEVYSGETMFLWESEWVCIDCFKAGVESLLNTNPEQVDLEMSLGTKEV